MRGVGDLDRVAAATLPWQDLRGKQVMVTGGGGFLAAYLIKSLLTANCLHQLGLQVICVARSMHSVQLRLAPPAAAAAALGPQAASVRRLAAHLKTGPAGGGRARWQEASDGSENSVVTVTI